MAAVKFVYMNAKQTPCAAKPLKGNKNNNVAVAWVTTQWTSLQTALTRGHIRFFASNRHPRTVAPTLAFER